MANCSQNTFGPAVIEQCGFDFTLLFEQIFMSMVPSGILIVAFLARLPYLLRQDKKAAWSNRYYLRQCLLASFGALQITLLCLWASAPKFSIQTAIPAASLNIVDALVIALLSGLEFTRSVHPSTVLTVYLFFSLWFDAVQLRTLWLLHDKRSLTAIATASLGIKMILLIIEARPKRNLLLHPYRNLSLETTSGFLSKIAFWWLNPLLWKGFRSTLTPPDMCQLEPDMYSMTLEQKFRTSWEFYSTSTHKHKLIRATLWAVKWKILAAAVPRLLQSAFTFAQPFLTFRVIDYIDEASGKDRDVGYGLIGATALIYIGLAVSSTMYKHKTYQMITQVRGGLITLIYPKTLRLSNSNTSDSAAATLMMTDTNAIAQSWTNIHELWVSPIDVGVSIYLLERKLGFACVAPIVLAIGSVLASGQIAKILQRRQSLWLAKVQERVSFTSRFLLDLKWLKMIGIASLQGEKMEKLRAREIAKAKSYLRIDTLVNVCANTSSFLSPIAVILLYAFTRHNLADSLTSGIVYYALTVVALMSSPLGLALFAFPNFLASLACFNRIQAYMKLEERIDYRHFHSTAAIGTTSFPDITSPKSEPVATAEVIDSGVNTFDSDTLKATSSPIFSIKDAAFGYELRESPVLKRFSWDCFPKSFTVVFGVVGSGKTTLLKALLGEVLCLQGSVSMTTSSVAYCSQTVWLQNCSLRDNVLGGQPYDEQLYKDVISATCLESDISQLPQKEDTLLGTNAIKLSGGQSQRVALARAIYARRPLLLLDDCFSGLDAATEESISRNMFSRNGLLQRLGMTVVLATHNQNYRKLADSVLTLGSGGTITSVEKPYHLQVRYRDGDSNSDEDAVNSGSTKSFDNVQSDKSELETDLPSTPPVSHQLMVLDDSARSQGDTAIYKYYIGSFGISRLLVYLGLNAVCAFCMRFAQVWVGFWVDALQSETTRRTNYIYGFVYAAFGIGSILFFGACLLFMFQIIVPRSGKLLHKSLLKATMGAAYIFYTGTDSGVTLNRFSQDLTLVDEDLPNSTVSLVYDVFMCAAQAALICAGARYISVVLPVLGLVVYFIQMTYLRTSRQVRHLDLEAKSPLLSHILDMYTGLETIRAYGWVQSFENIGISRLENSQRPFYTLYCIQRWLGLVLNMLVALVATLLIALATQIDGTTTTNSIGTALINVVGFSQTLSSLIVSYTSLETSLGAIARIRSFVAEVPQEDHSHESSHSTRLDSVESGNCIKFNSAVVSYGSAMSPVLRNFSLDVGAGVKVGICGRSGSGKSSVMLALLRMIPTIAGSITINGIDISTIPTEAVRSLFIVVTQQPILFPGSLRSNIDPFSNYPDEKVYYTLEKLGLSHLVSSHQNLDIDIEQLALSHGQKQLISICRAILEKDRKNILLLDEITSSLDTKTEAQVMRVIHQEFGSHTVLSISHRLSTLLQCDRIVVLDSGEIVESGAPNELLQNDSGLFQKLWYKQQDSAA